MKLPSAILEERVIPVARGLDAASARPLMRALETGGLHVLEVTVEDTLGIEAIAAVSGGENLVGAGTVMSVTRAALAVEAGAQFLVTPHLDEELFAWASARSIPLLPGAFTPTEVARAWSLRPPAVKLFPASLGGPGYLRSLLGPFPDLVSIPTGGVDDTNIAAFLEAGAVAVGVGGWLTSDIDAATERARALRSKVV